MRAPFLSIALASVAGLAVTACSGEDVAESFLERAIESQSGKNIDIDMDGDTVRIETEDGSFEMNTDADGGMTLEGVTEDGETVQIFGGGGLSDVNWPDSVPLPDGLEVQVVSEQDYGDGPNFVLIGTVPGASTDVADTFIAALLANGYTQEAITRDGSGSVGGSFVSSDRDVSASFTPLDAELTYISIGITPPSN